MNLSELQRKLIAAAKTTPADERVPYAFEKRIMTHLAGKTAPDGWTLWGRALSKAAVCCVAFMLLMAAGSYFVSASAASTGGNTESLSQDVEQTLFAAAASNTESETW